ncbi:beige/BEACH domain protein [Metarhizium robertsii ARSEF 23]|uniref:Beige protein homolog 1 n=1 Tax=Metarhizium robertsii (strain ARSEF 23 / ATCC MYA-3075) TaxID=655844 RepID=E9FDB0_METRA|nr:beige/BEACH domain protein [Metarhizium robertsii ARSEF 23]EFY94276.2 beige/BEACH domain protein [Metarhizium robertsii ARSEF 23]
MSSHPRRCRSSTSASVPVTSKSFDILRNLLDGFATAASLTGDNGYPDIDKLVKPLRDIHQHVSASGSPALQDDFRHARGFDILLDVLRAFSGFYDPQKRSEADMMSLFKLLGASLNVLSSVLRNHSGNKRFFRYRVAGGGWEALEQVIASIGLGGAEPDPWVSCHVFGKLLAFALDDEALDLLCQSIAKLLRPEVETAPPPTSNGDDDKEMPPSDDGDDQWDLVLARSAENIGPNVRDIVKSTSVIQFPEILRPVVSFWMAMPREANSPATPSSIFVLETILCAISDSIFNRAAVHSTGVLSQFLHAAFGQEVSLAISERERLLAICKLLMFLGVNEPADTQFLLAASRPDAADFCLEMMSRYAGPSFFQFDLSLHGHSSLELSTLGRPFPPQSTAGYTFTAWIRIENFDSTSHTTLFGVFDASQTCFVLMYLERDTRNFILQTSVYSNKPSVRFKSVAFSEGKWYHIAIVHRRPKTMTASKASLYVNGEFAEQVRCNYPLTPPLSNDNNESFASFNSNHNKTNPVQAFLGTPLELSGKVGPGRVVSRWSLASAHLFEDVLSDDYLAVHHGLGPRYQGNYQDSLGGFQTYETSATLGLRNEITHPGKDENSDILRAVRDKASTLLPECRIMLSILPSATFPENVQYLDTGLLRSLPRISTRNLFRISSQEGAPLAINCAVPSLPDALLRAQGMASFRGTPIVAVPSYLDENLWRLAGFTPLALKLLERATTADETVRSIEILFHCIRKSWRNSEAMERDNGYGILGMLLRIKVGYGTQIAGEPAAERLLISNEDRDSLLFRILSLILGFVGYNHAEPIDSFIVNPLAYRILLIDLDIWRKSTSRIQELYYKQFLTFAVNSKHHEFNSRRLTRMRIVKRLLDAMKGEAVSEDVVSHFMLAFEILVKSNLSQEVMRALSLFITYAFHSPTNSNPRTPKPLSSIPRPGTPGTPKRIAVDFIRMATPPAGTKFLSRRQLGVRVLGMYSRILCEKGNTNHIKKFARTVTNKWLLYLLADDDAEVVMHGCRILARLLVSHGSNYTSKFAGKSGGFIIMASKLKRFWANAKLWPICFSILFGYDAANIGLEQAIDPSSLLTLFSKRKVAYPESLVIITSMLQHGLRDVMNRLDESDSQTKGSDVSDSRAKAANLFPVEHKMTNPEKADSSLFDEDVLLGVIRFLLDLQERSADFRDFVISSEWMRMLLTAVYPCIVSTDAVTPEVELNSRDSALTFEGSDVIIRPIGRGSAPAPIVRTTSVDVLSSPQSTPPKGTPLRRASSFVLLTAQKASSADQAHLELRSRPSNDFCGQISGGPVFDGMLELVLRVFLDQVWNRKDFSGFSLFAKVPPGFQEHQAYFESYLWRKILGQLTNRIHANQKSLCEPRLLTNISRFCSQMSEAIFEGWFIDGAEVAIDFIGSILEYLQRPDISNLKSVRLCSQAVSTVRNCLLRIVLLKLSDLENAQVTEKEAKDFMNTLGYWQMSILACFDHDDDYFRLFWYQLYMKLIDGKTSIRIAAANLLRIIMVQKPDESAALIRSCITPDQRQLSRDFQKLTEVDDETFVLWVDKHRPSLDRLFFGSIAKTWEDFVIVENQRTAESAKSRLSKRKDKLKVWYSDGVNASKTLLNHDVGNTAWMKSIFNSEYFKYQRLLQDQQDDMAYLGAAYRKMEKDLRRPGAVFSEPTPLKWKLDRTEGRNRMRLRLLPDAPGIDEKYQSKGKAIEAASVPLRVNTAISSTPPTNTPSRSLSSTNLADGNDPAATVEPDSVLDKQEGGFVAEDDFELVDDPNEPIEGEDTFEDKNRKVMRRLEHGDQVQAAYNMSRITGLEACEGILIVGKDALYMMDNVFQCASGDIVNVWQAPPEERDPFTMVVTGTKTLEKRQTAGMRDQDSRHWKWHDVISFSKRRFLFRDVAIEIFFTDGRSYLLTMINSAVRDTVYGKLLNKAPHTNTANALPNPEDAWRLEALKTVDESPQGFGAGLGSRIGTLFNSSPSNPIVKRWQRGEVSNFHYLMMVNTMAGRTFNDLTQYPVFPWILADYTSEDLDLEDPATFRDLSKPMGAQSQARVPGFVETYSALKEIGQTPFHYGTHYSSAMIVSSYLIRLPPFVQSYLLVQGDSFDHADRLFQSVADAWASASSKNKTDVRELIPEFFCLPEFLTNINGYDFGRKQSTGARVDHVRLPPWAKGDPKIFIAKHREALESPYVSENLHLWIDLVFGCKQRGEAAVENLNVFHHLSYAGASDLDRITDANERAITAGVIHNFGQTPHQVFNKPHPAREYTQCSTRRLDTSIFSLTSLPRPLLESHERVSSLIYAPKLDRLLCASAFRLNFAPYDKFLEWGYADNSIRFFFSDNRKPAGLFENLHTGQISCACFADSKTLITAGEDCVVSVYTVHTSVSKPVELVPRSSVFGHKTLVTAMAVSKAFSTFVTASADGQAFLWDLNQLTFIRKLPLVRLVECAAMNNVSGEVLLCSGPNVLLYTLNGTLILDQNVCGEQDDYVHSCAFYEGAGDEWLENCIIFTGHSKGRVNVWRKCVLAGKWTLELLRRLDHFDFKGDTQDNTDAGITCITPMPTCVYTGDEDGRVYEWNFGRGDR